MGITDKNPEGAKAENAREDLDRALEDYRHLQQVAALSDRQNQLRQVVDQQNRQLAEIEEETQRLDQELEQQQRIIGRLRQNRENRRGQN